VIVLDVNVLLAAYRADHVHHEVVRPWFDATLVPGADVVVPDLVWVGFLRLVTNSHVFEVPSTLAEGFSFVDSVMGSSAYVSVPAIRGIWGVVREIATESDAHGNLVPDAYIAAVAMTHAAPVATMDRDFRRFTDLRIVDPTKQ
jgi:toxin-antitoxin system PIN domain toxin